MLVVQDIQVLLAGFEPSLAKRGLARAVDVAWKGLVVLFIAIVTHGGKEPGK